MLRKRGCNLKYHNFLFKFMKKYYKVVKNKPKVYKSTGGLNIKTYPQTKYSIYFVSNKHYLHVLDIKDHFKYPKGIGEGICRLLNQNKIILELDV